MKENHPIEGLMLTAMSSIHDMVDVNTIVGEPIESADGMTIIPISKVSGDSAGGICGYWSSGKIDNSTNYGEIYASTSGGGIVGSNTNSGALEVNYCINDGYVSGLNAGGIMGAKTSQSVTFNSCLNDKDAEVISTGFESGGAGGIVGRKTNAVNFYFYNCANLGSVSGYYSGGIFGNISSWGGDILANCFGGGKITGTKVGGLAGRGYGEDTAYNCYYLKSESVNYSTGEPAEDKITATGITNITQTEINSLNNYIDNDPNEIGTTGWKKWTLDRKGNPIFVD